MSHSASNAPKPRKNLTMMIAALFILCTAATVLIFCQWLADRQMLSANGQPDFNTLPAAEYKDGLIVKGNIDIVLGAYAESGRTSFGVRTSDNNKSVYYVVPVYDEDEYGNITFKYLLTYQVEPNDFDKMEEIYTNTWNYRIGETALSVENAKIHALPNDIRQFFFDWAQTPDEFWNGGTFFDWCAQTKVFGTDDKEAIASKFIPFMMDKVNSADTNLTVVCVSAGISAITLVILIALIRRYRRIMAAGKPADPDIIEPEQ